MDTLYVPSIVTSKGENTISADMFKPRIIPSPYNRRKKNKDEESECSDNSIVKAYKK